MELVKIQLDDIQKEVYGLFYIYDSKYYFIYTEKELDENNYVILYASQVGKETKTTENGPVDTGYLVGIEVTNPDDQQKLQQSISAVVEDKKNNTKSSQIQYLPMSTLTNLKIASKKRFRLLKNVIVDNFKLEIEDRTQNDTTDLDSPNVVNNVNMDTPLPSISAEQPLSIPQGSEVLPKNEDSKVAVSNDIASANSNVNIIIDYRSKYFEEEEKNKELQKKIDELTQKLNEIKKIIE